MGLVGAGEGRPENVVIGGEGADAILSGSDTLLTMRFSVCNGLGVITEGSFDVIFLSSVKESMDDRLALLAWPDLVAGDATLDLRLDRSGASGVLGPDRIDSTEFRECIGGLIT